MIVKNVVVSDELVGNVLVENVLVEVCESCCDTFASKLEDLPPVVNGVDPTKHCRECFEEKAFGIISTHEPAHLHAKGRPCRQVEPDKRFHGNRIHAELAQTIIDRL